jgi:hypothetical protein
MDQDRDPSQTLHWQKVKFLHEKYMVLKVGYVLYQKHTVHT